MRWTIWPWYLRDSECTASNWNILSATCSSRRCHFWDTLLVGVAWNATRIVLRVSASSLVLSVITDDLYLIMLTSQHTWWPWRKRTSRSSGNRFVRQHSTVYVIPLISLLILSRPVARKTLISSPSTRERTGCRCWTMTCHSQVQFPVMPSVYLPYRKKTPSASRSSRGLCQVIFHHGLKSKV